MATGLVKLSQGILAVSYRTYVQRLLTILNITSLVSLYYLVSVAVARSQSKRSTRRCQVLRVLYCWRAPEQGVLSKVF